MASHSSLSVFLSHKPVGDLIRRHMTRLVRTSGRPMTVVIESKLSELKGHAQSGTDFWILAAD